MRLQCFLVLGNTGMEVLGEKVCNYYLEVTEIYCRCVGKVRVYADNQNFSLFVSTFFGLYITFGFCF